MSGPKSTDRQFSSIASATTGSGAPQILLSRLTFDVEAVYQAHRQPPSRVVVAVSGGADSVALLRLLDVIHRTADPPAVPANWLVVAHWNHALRGEESDQDQAFVEQLAAEMGIPCITGRAGETTTESRSEESFRNQRYEFLEHVARRQGARYVALAHTADDQVETVLHQLFRGTGPSGLAGMPTFRSLGADVVLIRPLLHVRRDTLRELLTALEQTWRHDSSNDSSEYRRNWLRNELLPLVRDKYPCADEAIVRCAAGQAEFMGDARAAAKRLADRMFSGDGGSRLRIQSPQPGFDPWYDSQTNSKLLGRTADDELAAWGEGSRTCPRSLLVLALNEVWDQYGWPRQGMTSKHWGELVCLIQNGRVLGTTVLNLPGGLRAECSEVGTVVVGRQSE